MAAGGSEVIIGLGIASILAGAAGTAVSYMGAQQQATAARQQGEYNARVAENNAVAAQQQAAFDARQQRQKMVRVAGAQTAAYGKSGAALEGASDVLYDSAVQGELDAMTVEYKGQLAADRYRQGGELARMEAQASESSARSRGTGSLISGIFSTAEKSYNLARNPGF